MSLFLKSLPQWQWQSQALDASLPQALQSIGQQGWSILGDALAYPLAVLQRSALQHNLQWMQAYADRKGVLLAPHGKTTMSPELFRLQLDAGAWGITFANVSQLAVGVHAGVRRALIANQVLAPADLGALHALQVHHPDLQVWFLVDSIAQLRLLEAWAAQQVPGVPPWNVLIEMGVPDKRTGCRTLEEGLALARGMQGSAAVRLCGLECYEGNAAIGDSAHDVAAVDQLVRRVLALARACDAQNLWASDTVMFSAGGSAVFDLVLPLLTAQGLSRPVQGVLRSGCYITHDHGGYRHYLQLVEQREGLVQSLRPALEVWALVQSVPQPGLALLGCGKRDISYDLEMPLPQRIARAGVRHMQEVQPVPADWRITALNDQHAYLQWNPAGPAPAVGDRVVLGISHPCTTFDKWRWMPLVEDDGRISGAIQTFF